MATKVMGYTYLQKLKIKKFRALKDVDIDFARRITVICGKNGTAKSSILGIAAQIFSFDKDYTTGTNIVYKQITGLPFKSIFSDHFRMSQKFDLPGSMSVGIELHNGYTNSQATANLTITKRSEGERVLPRVVVRNNSTAKDSNQNESRNFIHPVIFLSLKRLYPIAAREYRAIESDYLENHKQDFISLTNELLNHNSSEATETNGTISSAVSHGDNYDHESVSAGEDNAGQIILALMSFEKLKKEYADYKGGLLLIDEVDAGLFPTAQINLLNILDKKCKDLNIQVIMTSHSPTLIAESFKKSQLNKNNHKNIYLSDSHGDIRIMNDWSWEQIDADIHTRTLLKDKKTSTNKVRIYFEDKEAEDFLKALMYRQPIKSSMKFMSKISLGCNTYIEFVKYKIPEFSEESIICLDGDTSNKIPKKGSKSIITLPGNLPPDQLIFEYLYNLPPDHIFWHNQFSFTRSIFTNMREYRKIEKELKINDYIKNGHLDIKKCVISYKGSQCSREMFKNFYKNPSLQELISSNQQSNPWFSWISSNPNEANIFLEKIKFGICNILEKKFSIKTQNNKKFSVKLKKQVVSGQW